MDLELTGKAALVTGGSRGIGKAVAGVLASEGADVVVVARGREALDATARELTEETGRGVVAVPADTGSDESVRAMAREAFRVLGGVDILVNCAARPAGGWLSAPLPDVTYELLQNEINVKVMGYLRCAREVAPCMRERGWGRIVNVSGGAARRVGSIVGSIRNISVVAMTRNLAAELGPHGINVTVVHPGLTRTERLPGLIAEEADRDGISPEEVERRMAGGNLVHRVIDAGEVTNVIAFLASPKSAAVNGDVIEAGGGMGTAIHY